MLISGLVMHPPAQLRSVFRLLLPKFILDLNSATGNARRHGLGDANARHRSARPTIALETRSAECARRVRGQDRGRQEGGRPHTGEPRLTRASAAATSMPARCKLSIFSRRRVI